MPRTEEQKRLRKEKDATLDAEYKIFFDSNQSLEQECTNCKQKKLLSEFIPNYAFRFRCRECHAKIVKKWRKEEPELASKSRYKSFRKSADYIKSQKVGKSCLMCGKNYPPCAMDFNHLDLETKLSNVSQLYGKSKERIDTEIAKCELICANCHRDKTQSEKDLIPVSKNRQFQPEIVDTTVNQGDPVKSCLVCKITKHENDFTLLRTGKRHSYCRKCLRDYNNRLNREQFTASEQFIIEFKDNKPCTDCKVIFRYWMLDFDHISGQKESNINMLRMHNIESVKEEISKCELVCVNCHRQRTHRRKLLSGIKQGEALTCECIKPV